MKSVKPYISVSCDFIDQIEILATHRKQVLISYSEAEKVETLSDVIETWFTKEKVEYLKTVSGVTIRLDNVVDLDGVVHDSSCTI